MLNFSPPKIRGSHPKKKIKRAEVAQDQNPSRMVKEWRNFSKEGILLFFERQKSKKGISLHPQAQRFCCRY